VEKAPTPEPGPVAKDPIARLIDKATGVEPQVKRPEEKRPAMQLPSSLTRPQIQRGMRRIKGKVQGCFDRYKVPGWATLNVTIGGDGSVRTARVRGIFSGTPTGGCLKNAVSSAKFPPFASPSLTIEYPFHLREG
jgi:hypothetical protein